MTNETIFYIIGLILGFILGYASRSLKSRKQTEIEIHIERGDRR